MEVLYQVLEVADKVIYATLGITAMFGIFTVIMVTRRIAQKRFARPAQAESFLEEVHDSLKSGNTEAVVELCDSPRYWSKAVPQLIVLAIQNLDRPANKVAMTPHNRPALIAVPVRVDAKIAERRPTDQLEEAAQWMRWHVRLFIPAPVNDHVLPRPGDLDGGDVIAGCGEVGAEGGEVATVGGRLGHVQHDHRAVVARQLATVHAVPAPHAQPC